MNAVHLQRPVLLSPASDHHPLPLLHIGHLSVNLHEGAVQLLAILTRELKLLQLAVGFAPTNNLDLRCKSAMHPEEHRAGQCQGSPLLHLETN